MVNIRVASLFLLFVLIFSISVLAQSTDRIDSDGDSVLDAYDKCPNTNPEEDLPIILRNPEFLGCSCSQIFNLLEEEHCKEIYCFPGRPLEIRNSAFSSRPNPCPMDRCENNTLFTYVVGEIRCIQGNEVPYDCEEVIIENSDLCINGLETNNDFVVDQFVDKDIFDVVALSYLANSRFVDILSMSSKSDLVENNEIVLDKVIVERVVSVNERVVNNRRVLVADVSIIVKPNNYVKINDFVFVERILGDLSNKNLVISDESFYDSVNQLIVWEVDYLKNDVVFNYRITPGYDLNFEFFVHGETKSVLFKELIVPLLLLIIVAGLVVSFVINMRNKNKVFKN